MLHICSGRSTLPVLCVTEGAHIWALSIYSGRALRNGACRLGWKYPWGVRLKVTQLFLVVVLRAQCEADADEAAELESLLVERLWPPLGISAAVHDSLMPFTNFQEYCRTG